MVKLEEVEDEELNQAQPGPIEESDDDYVDTDSSLSDDEDDDIFPSETISERIVALKDMVPAATRRKFSAGLSNTWEASKSVGLWGGKAAWVVTTSALLILVPFAMATTEEQAIMEQEKEMKAQEELRGGMTPGVSAGEKAGAGPTL